VRASLKHAIANIVSYLTSYCGMKCYGLATDDLMMEIRPANVDIINVLPKSDTFWASRHCADSRSMLSYPNPIDQVTLDKIANSVTPDELNAMDEYERFRLVRRHEIQALKSLAKTEKVIVTFNFKSKKNYNCPSKDGDALVRIEVNASNCEVKTFFGGQQVDNVSFLQKSYACFPLNEWRTDEANKDDDLISI